MVQILGCPKVEEYEALALLEVVKWVHSLGYVHVLFKSDSTVVTNAVDQ